MPHDPLVFILADFKNAPLSLLRRVNVKCLVVAASMINCFLTAFCIIGCGCPDRVKVFMQLIGDRNVSPYFTLRGKKGGIPLLKRGFTDIFLVNVKGRSLGPV